MWKTRLANIVFYCALIFVMFLPYRFNFLFEFADNKLPFEVAQFVLTCTAAYILLIYTAKQVRDWIKSKENK